MTLQEQLINDIKQLPDDILSDLSGIVKKLIVLNNKAVSTTKPLSNSPPKQENLAKLYPLLGCAENKIRMADDFDAPMEEMEDYV